MKPIRLIPDDTKIRFMTWAKPAVVASVAACLASLVLFAVVG